MRIDLHAHSTASDGTDPPAAVMRHARDAGLDVVALTDHDTVAGHAEAAASMPPGLTLVPGAEVSCIWEGISLHLLAYLFDPFHPELSRELELLHTDRERRAREMVERLRPRVPDLTYGAVAAYAGDGSVGRPHIARALIDLGVVNDVPGAFTDEWIGSGAEAYVEKYSLDPCAAVRLVRDAGGVSVFAHPSAHKRGRILPDEAVDALAEAGLFGLEVDHPDHDDATRERLRDRAAALGLVVTGSSDDHGALTGRRLGCETTDPEVFAAICESAAGTPVTA